MANRQAYSDEESNGGRYSDDFVSDESRTPTPARSGPRPYQERLRGRGRGARGRGRGAKPGRGTSRNSEPANMRRSHDSVTQRVLSASRNKVNELRNKVEELKIQIRDLQIENKLYKKMQFRQEKALKGFEDKENDLPNILEKHNNEIRSLKEQNRRLREKYDKSDRYLRDAEDELERVKKRLKKYKEVAEEKELLERDELSRKLTKAEIDMEEKDVKIKELERHLETLKKNHRHELGIEVARQKELKKQLEEVEERNSKMTSQLKDKEKELEHKNIYSRPIAEGSDTGSPARKPKKKSSSLTDLTPRDKAKFYAEKKREELKKQKEMKAEQEKKKRQKWEEDERQREKFEKTDNYESPKSPELRSPDIRKTTPPDFSFDSIDKGIAEREREEERRRKEDEQRWQDRQREEARQKEQIDRRRKDLERRQEENARREQEDRERRQREERMRMDLEREEKERKEQLERERKQREEKERQEREERERREKEKEEQERRIQMEKKKLENDPKIAEERRKKDELLKKLQAMDELGNAGASKRDTFNNSPQHKRVKENSHGGSSGDGFDSPSRRSERKEYSFTKPVNNLHQGKPSHDETSFRASRRHNILTKDDDDTNGYQPSFVAPARNVGSKPAAKPLSIFDDDDSFKPAGKSSTSNSSPAKDKKSSNLLENLFGPQATKDSTVKKRSEESETFFVTSKTPETSNTRKSNTTTTFPWDTASSSAKANGTKSNFNFDSGSTIYGGGAALVDDDDFSSSRSKVLPKRQKQANLNTFSSKPTVTAVTAFDEDFEEVVL